MERCVFCRIVAGHAPAEIVRREDGVVAFRDINPMAPTHILIIPEAHIPSLEEVRDDQWDLVGRLFRVARQVARDQGLTPRGYRLVLNTGSLAGQSVYHLHLHLLGGRPLRWPPG